PYGELEALRRPLLRTTVLRLLLGVALAAVLVAALVLAWSRDARPDPLLPAGTTGMIVLDLSASAGLQPEFGQLLRRIAAADEPTGVIVFSDTAYELVPPGTPGKDLAPMIRFFSAKSVDNPWESFQTGTNLAVGLETARQVLERDRIERGTIVLASDLEFFPDDGPRLTAALAELRSEGTEVRILPLGAREEQKRFFEAVVGGDVFIELDEATAVAAGRSGATLRLAEENMPWLFVGLALALALLLAANERACGRLRLTALERARA
ncbi:MAG: VWA domain-containing protein, partial [Actinobacteria bacterium]|nr:VWA domain-containing protein [Actinomycetota bacterium]